MTPPHLAAPTRRLARAFLLAGLLAASRAAAQAPAAGDSARPASRDTTRRTTDSTAAAAANPARPPQAGAAVAGPRVDSLLTGRAAMGGRIRLRTSGVDEWAKGGAHDASKLVLYLDGRAMAGAAASRVSGAGRPEQWEIRLRRGDDAKDAWEAVLGSPPEGLMRDVRVGLGPAGGPEFASAPDSVVRLSLVLARPAWLWVTATLWLLLIVGFVHLARTTGIIRDSPAPIPPPPGDAPPPEAPVPPATGNPLVDARRTARAERSHDLALRPYSMARSQMAFWFILITTMFLGIWMITGDWHGVITTQALFLMGLGAGTALAAGTVESNTREVQRAGAPTVRALDAHMDSLTLQSARATPADTAALDREMVEVSAARAAAAPEAPACKGFFRDILNEKDGPALHRYQHLVWTLIIGAIFVVGAWKTLALPELDGTLLLLMGISSATYVGFKARENQS